MKVEGPKRTGAAGATQKTGNTATADGTFGTLLAGQAENARGAAATQALTHVDTLLAVQGAEDPAQGTRRKRMRERADSILDSLETVRQSLLTGTLTVAHIVNIAERVAAQKESVSDPNLAAILDEIDLRAQVELAKLKKSIQ